MAKNNGRRVLWIPSVDRSDADRRFNARRFLKGRRTTTTSGGSQIPPGLFIFLAGPLAQRLEHIARILVRCRSYLA